MAPYTLLATLGFDERPVVRVLTDLGARNIEKILLAKPMGNEPRALKAVQEVKKIALSTGLGEERVEVIELNVMDFWGSVEALLRRIVEEAESRRIFLSLGGGLRLLVLEAYTAVLAAPEHVKQNITVRIDVEGEAHEIVIDGRELWPELGVSAREEDLLSALHNSPGSTLSELSKVLSPSTSSIWKTLKRLTARGLVRRVENKYYITEKGLVALRVSSWLRSGGGGRPRSSRS